MAMPSHEDIHQQMAEAYELQREFDEGKRTTESSYNEYLVQAKLEPPLFKLFWSYCREHDLNRSSGIKSILTKFFSINV